MEQTPVCETTCSKREPPAFVSKAKAAFEAGQIGEAIALYEQAISQGHNSERTHKTLGEMYLWIHNYQAALRCLQKARLSQPACDELLEHILLSLVSLGRTDDALEEARKALDSRPETEIKKGSLTEALVVTNSSKTTEHCLSRTEAMSRIAEVLFQARQYGKAEEWYEGILEHEPDALVNARLAHICRSAGRLSEAAEYQKNAVELAPHHGEYMANLGTLQISLGKVPEGIGWARKAVEQAPEKANVHSSLLANLHYQPDLNPRTLFEEHKRWGRLHAPQSRARTSHGNTPDPDRRLKVGYISADFRAHPVAYFFEPLLDRCNRKALEVYGYGNVLVPDEITKRLGEKFDRYRDICGLDDRQVCRLIEQDQIDILVDLGGHTNDNRLTVLSYKPAPVQVTYLGYFETTGAEQIDYFLTDELNSPPESQRFHTEELVCLPDGFLCYRPPDCAPSITPLPAIQNGCTTFGMFGNNRKINPFILSLWAKVLENSENSKLLLMFKGGQDRQIREHYLSQFEQLAIAPERVDVRGHRSVAEYLKAYGEVDIMLDTYPYNGGTTTCDALWMGVPVISLFGEHHMSRVGLSILTNLGMKPFIASTPAEYLARASTIDGNLHALAKIRASLRQRIAVSTLCDAGAFGNKVEAAYRKMWHRWCRTQRADTAGPDSKQAQNGVLEFFISRNSPLQFDVSKAGLPSFLLKAGDAVKVGKVSEAAALLDDQAVRTVQQMAIDDPSRTDALFMLAALFAKIGKVERAEQFYREVLKHRRHALVLFELANICRDTGRLSQAVSYQEQAIEMSPDSPELWTTLAEYLIRMGQTQKGIDLLRKAVETSPDKVNHSKFLWHLHQLPELDQDMLFKEHKRWARIHAPADLARVSHDNVADPDRQLRIGYISPDFCGHSVAYFFESILDGHNREVVDVYGYGDIACPDQVTEQLKRKFGHYRNICGLHDKKIVRLIEQDKIDILVDLAGHTSGNRLGVLARKPAPIQVTYLGFPDTTGMSQLDYRLTDELADLPEAQKFHTEKLVFLPQGFLCYAPPGFAPPVTSLPAVKEGCFTFGSFNNNCKIQPSIMELWAKILKTAEKSRLLLKFGGGDDAVVREYYFRQFENLGIARQRVAICGRKPTIEHFKLYGRMDIALDTHPYNGTTTTCEAMWMGVPTISLVGKAHASRVGLSILSRVGLGDFAAFTPDEYVAKAVAFSGEIENLAKIRTSLRSMMFNSPLCDKKGFTRSLEDVYRKMWHQWCVSCGVADVCGSIDSEPLHASASAQPKLNPPEDR
ncbi:MAG: tetratricopeptide repeat protein [Phycisphaerae bacterium]|nr:tetratricopeptide repeat protein [Phycisphaerae bacterium]